MKMKRMTSLSKDVKTSLVKLRESATKMTYSPEEQKQIDAITQMIHRATDDMYDQENWEKNMQVVDFLTNTISPIILKEAIRSVRKNLESSISTRVLHTLTLVEALVKNCGRSVHREIATERFMGQFQKLYHYHADQSTRDSLEISERILELVQAWGEAFLPYQRDLPLFSATYHNMRKKGVVFSTQYDDSKAPVLTPPVDEFAPAASEEFTLMKSDDVARLARNITEMMEDMLDAVKTREDIQGNDILRELMEQCKRLEPRIITAVEEAASEGLESKLELFLGLNDTLQSLVCRYDDVISSFDDDDDQQVEEVCASGEDSSSSSSSHHHNESKAPSDDLLDFFSSPPVPAANPISTLAEKDNDAVDTTFDDFFSSSTPASTRPDALVPSSPERSKKSISTPQEDRLRKDRQKSIGASSVPFLKPPPKDAKISSSSTTPNNRRPIIEPKEPVGQPVATTAAAEDDHLKNQEHEEDDLFAEFTRSRISSISARRTFSNTEETAPVDLFVTAHDAKVVAPSRKDEDLLMPDFPSLDTLDRPVDLSIPTPSGPCSSTNPFDSPPRQSSVNNSQTAPQRTPSNPFDFDILESDETSKDPFEQLIQM